MQHRRNSSQIKKNLSKITTIFIVFCGLIYGAWLLYMEKQGNFHTITFKEAYRSGQLNRDNLEHYVRKFGLRSVINLRGAGKGEKWYEEEIRTCRELGVIHFDIELSAYVRPSQNKISSLLNIFAIAPKPVFIHCLGGADRSGLASALWKLKVDGASKQEAQKQSSILYGHLPFGRAQVMDDCIEKI